MTGTHTTYPGATGVDVSADAWRGVVGPKGLNDGQIRFWDSTRSRMVATDDWKKSVETNLWEPVYRNSAETRRFLDAEYRDLKEVLVGLGLAK